MAKPVGYEEVTATTLTAVGLTAATIDALEAKYSDLWVLIVNTAFPLAFSWYGTPTSATVQQLAVKDQLEIRGSQMMRTFKGIGIGGSAIYAVNYFSGR